MQIIKRGEVTKYAFDAREEPVLHVKQDEAFQLETEDALTGLIEDDSDNPKVHSFVGDAHVDLLNKAYPPIYNPVIGPIHVDGCEAGDVLAVSFDFIDPFGELGALGDHPHFQLVFMNHLACPIPSHVEPTAVLLDVFGGCVMGGVHRAGGPQHHERVIGPQ